MTHQTPRRPAIARTPFTGLAIAASLLVGIAPAAAQPASPEPAAMTPSPGAEAAFDGKRTRELLAAQVLLDRAHFSPGVIDGYGGGNTSRALAAWQKAQGLEATGTLDQPTLAKLRQADGAPVLTSYTVSEADVKGPFGPLPSGMEAMAELDAAHYESAAEGIAEKFHMSLDFLKALNPGADFSSPGTTLTVAAVKQSSIAQDVARIEVDGAKKSVRAFAADGTLLADLPATVGSGDFPSPTGTMKVTAIAENPKYYFSPEGRDWGPDKKLTIAAGPNNPVGAIWIDLEKEGYGIHGTPDPRLIGKTASHGCVRLTNWDAQALAAAVKKGTTVEFL